MNKYKIEFFVGIFALFGIMSLFIIMIQFTDVKNIYIKEKNYKINAIFKNIGNLKKKARVTIGGVKIGYVSKIELTKIDNDDYYPKIELSINNKYNKIPIDSSINILMSSLLGDNYIQIEIGNDDIVLKDGDVVTLTTQALILEDLISKLAFNK